MAGSLSGCGTARNGSGKELARTAPDVRPCGSPCTWRMQSYKACPCLSGYDIARRVRWNACPPEDRRWWHAPSHRTLMV